MWAIRRDSWQACGGGSRASNERMGLLIALEPPSEAPLYARAEALADDRAAGGRLRRRGRGRRLIAAALLGLRLLDAGPDMMLLPVISLIYGVAAPPTSVGGRVVVAGAARFTALTERVLRIEYAGPGSDGFDDLPSTTVLERSPAGAPPFRQKTAAGVLTLSTGPLTLNYRHGGALLPAASAGCDVLNVTVHSTGSVWCLSMGVAPPSQRNLNGSFETTDCYVGWRHCLNVYDGKMQPGVVARAGYAVINDTSAVMFTQNESNRWPSGWRKPRSHAPESYADLIFFGHGTAYKDALRDYTAIGGAVPLMPWRAYGVWWSRYHRYSAASFKAEVLDGFDAHSLPLHSVVLDTDWHTGRGFDPATNCTRKTDQGCE
jgi:hypothetical protein